MKTAKISTPKTEAPHPAPQPVRHIGKRHLYSLIAIILVLSATSIYFYHQSGNGGSEQAEARTLAHDVSKLMILPAGEVPTIATVSDLTALKDQPFFADAQNGDKVLIYANAKKAILYRPGDDKIVNVAPLNIGDAAAS